MYKTEGWIHGGGGGEEFSEHSGILCFHAPHIFTFCPLPMPVSFCRLFSQSYMFRQGIRTKRGRKDDMRWVLMAIVVFCKLILMPSLGKTQRIVCCASHGILKEEECGGRVGGGEEHTWRWVGRVKRRTKKNWGEERSRCGKKKWTWRWGGREMRRTKKNWGEERKRRSGRGDEEDKRREDEEEIRRIEEGGVVEEKKWTWRWGGQEKIRTRKNWGEERRSSGGEGVDVEMRFTGEEKDEEEMRWLKEE